jgi:pimeloyl-ACP methyl ester carboxylesterase
VPELRKVPANGIEIAYETFGERDALPMLLVMGLGTQMVAWPDQLCQDLADRGHYVVRFDNRDVGASTHLHGVQAPPLRSIVSRRRRPPYTIDDMAQDALGLIDALDLGPVHLVGASMGGFIAQTVALRHPGAAALPDPDHELDRLARVGQADPRLIGRLMSVRPCSTPSRRWRRSSTPSGPSGRRGTSWTRTGCGGSALSASQRGYDPAGYRRQLAAVVAQANRTAALRRLELPTLVMHGLQDPLVAASGGLALARSIRGARFVGFAGMGHDLPSELWPEFADHIAALTRRAERRAAQAV